MLKMLVVLLLGLLQLVSAKIRGLQQQETVQLACPGGCPVLVSGPPSVWTRLYPAWLSVNVSIDNNKVLYNGKQIWPELAVQLSVNQVTNGDVWDPYDQPIPVHTSVSYQDTEKWQDKTIHPILIRILKLTDKDIAVESLEVKVVESPTDGLSLETLAVIPYSSTKPVCTCEGGKCSVKLVAIDKFEEYHPDLKESTPCIMDVVSSVEEDSGQSSVQVCKSSIQHHDVLDYGFWLFSLSLFAIVLFYVCYNLWSRHSARTMYTVLGHDQDELTLLSK